MLLTSPTLARSSVTSWREASGSRNSAACDEVLLRQTSQQETAAANAVALLSTAGNVALEKTVQGFWRAGCGPRAVVWPPLPQTYLVCHYSTSSLVCLIHRNRTKVRHAVVTYLAQTL